MRKMEYWVCHERGTKKKSESPTGIEPMTSHTPVRRSNHWATGRLATSEVIFTEFVVTRVLHTARISNVESTVCDNKERKMGSIPVGDSDFFLCPTLVTNWIIHLSHFFPSLKFTSFFLSLLSHTVLSTLLILAVCRMQQQQALFAWLHRNLVVLQKLLKFNYILFH